MQDEFFLCKIARRNRFELYFQNLHLTLYSARNTRAEELVESMGSPTGGQAIERPKGAHPTVSEANGIALNACKPDHPDATLADQVGVLFPTANLRATYVARVVANSKSMGFKMPPGKVPTGDANTIRDVRDAVQADAVA